MRALLVDFGGVIYRSAHELLPEWARRAGLPPSVAARSGPFGPAVDEPWEAMQRGELSEREYWRRRAEEIGNLFGQQWDTADLLLRLEDGPESDLVRPELLTLLDGARAAGIRAGVLSNDLAHFHGQEWVDRQRVLRRFHAVVDGSVTGILKPDRRAYLHAAEALGVRPGELVFVDDQPWNVAGARDAGATAIRLEITDPRPAFHAAAEELALSTPPETAAVSTTPVCDPET
jgi:putative hydrolase of the HAD superfamily